MKNSVQLGKLTRQYPSPGTGLIFGGGGGGGRGFIIGIVQYSCCMFLSFTDGYVIGHYANNARDFLYPAVPPYPGSGREVTLFKTSLFNPIRITVSIDQCGISL